ncbi:MAG: hypothetical protein JW763_10880 [candidate division Zixibacteria bacterium]|nr:hypothetical protein [candidate division Zixibacteria bacterium]
MAVSQKQIDANQRNARKSTGPKTARGKRISSRNAVKHGAFTNAVLIESPSLREDRQKYYRLLYKIRNRLNPTDSFQERLTREVADCVWRANRIIRTRNRLAASLCDLILSANPSKTACIDKASQIAKLIRYERYRRHQDYLACRLFTYIRQLQEDDDDNDQKTDLATKQTHFKKPDLSPQSHDNQPCDSPKYAQMPVFTLRPKAMISALIISRILDRIAPKQRNFRLQLPKNDVYIASAIKPP